MPWHLRPIKRSLFAGVLTGMSLAYTSYGHLAHADTPALNRGLNEVESETHYVVSKKLTTDPMRSPTYVEDRLADAQLHFRLRNYDRTRNLLLPILAQYPNHTLYSEAVSLAGETFYKQGEFLSAQRHFAIVMDRSAERTFQPHVGRALARLLDIAVRTHQFESAEAYLAKFAYLQNDPTQGALPYYRGKYHYIEAISAEPPAAPPQPAPSAQTPPVAKAQKQAPPQPAFDKAKLAQASQSFAQVPSTSVYYNLAIYFIGVIETLEGKYNAASKTFARVLKLPVKGRAQIKVMELAQLALGRLYYETEQIDKSIKLYESISPSSPRLDVALYEVAWAYLRRGDDDKAERALETLTIVSPNSAFVPDAKVLRGELLLRIGRYDQSSKAFSTARAAFRPIVSELDRALREKRDARQHFRMLLEQHLSEFDPNVLLPAKARQWTAPDPDSKHASAVGSEVLRTRQLLDETRELVRRLEGVIQAPNPVVAYADTRAQRVATTALRNRLTRLLRDTIHNAAAKMPARSNSTLATLRMQRLSLESMIKQLPVTRGDFQRRDEQLLTRYQVQRKHLSDLDVQIAGLEARVVAIERVMVDTKGVKKDPAGLAAIEEELKVHREALSFYRNELKSLKVQIESAQVHIGVGDARYGRDRTLREQYWTAVEQERAELKRLNAGMMMEYEPVFSRVIRLDSTLNRYDLQIDSVVQRRLRNLSQVVQEEKVNIDGYETLLAETESDTEDVVVGLVDHHFVRVRGRFKTLMMRSEVGHIDVAWARREEHRMRADTLSRERVRELQVMEDEYREVMDEGGSTKDKGGAQ